MIGFPGMLEFRWREWVGNAFLKPRAVIVPLLAAHGDWRRASPHPLPVLAAPAPARRNARTFRVIDDGDVDVLKSLGRRASA